MFPPHKEIPKQVIANNCLFIYLSQHHITFYAQKAGSSWPLYALKRENGTGILFLSGQEFVI